MHDLIEQFLVSFLVNMASSMAPRLLLHLVIGFLVALAVCIAAAPLMRDDTAIRWLALAAFLVYAAGAYVWMRHGPRRPRTPLVNSDSEV